MAERLTDINMSVEDAIIAIVEGNPGAIAACVEMLEHQSAIDPKAFPLMGIFAADTLGIYGSRLYVLWNDTCGRDVGKLLALFRGWQLGILTKQEISLAADERLPDRPPSALDLADVIKRVQAEIVEFHPEARN